MASGRFERSLLVTTPPHLGSGDTTPRIMWTVVASLMPVMAASVWFFGPSALLVTTASVLGAVVTEAGFVGRVRLRDGSGVITGILLGLTLPAGLPLWMAFLGGRSPSGWES
jgi:Na+-translocating ferredoxin:NAD+ oxidoreductase subunit D